MTDAITATDPPSLVSWYLGPHGPAGGRRYYERSDVLTGSPDHVGLADVGWAVLLAGGPRYQAAARLIDSPISVESVPSAPLHTLSSTQRAAIASCIGTFLTQKPGPATHIGVSLATKMVHPKRRASVPVVDNQTIYRRFMVPGWKPGATDGIGTPGAKGVAGCIGRIHACVADPSNASGWTALESDPRFSRFTRIELFDMGWTAIERGGPSTKRWWRSAVPGPVQPPHVSFAL